MDTENQPTNRDQGNNEPQVSPPKESIPSSGDPANQPTSPVPKGSSPPEEVKKINAPGIFQTLFTERRRVGSSIEKNLTRLEKLVEMNVRFFFGGEDESKNQ